MKTVHEVSSISGVSVRTLHYYDDIGLLNPTKVTEAGYRLYDDSALKRLQRIMLLRELSFSLKEIGKLLDKENCDWNIAVKQQIKLLTMQQKRLEAIIDLAKNIQIRGVDNMDFSAFNRKEIEEYSEQARVLWGNTEAYKEYEQRTQGKSKEEISSLGEGIMEIFKAFGEIKTEPAGSQEAQGLVRELQQYITDNFYTCTNAVLSGIGQMYKSGGKMSESIDKAGGKGTAEYAAKAIEYYCK